MQSQRNKWVLLLIIALAVFSVYLANPYSPKIFGNVFDYKLGLDLQGGTHLIYQGDLSNLAPENQEDAMNSVKDVIERRVNAFGVSEPVVAVSGSERLIIELPGIKDVDEAVRQIGLTPLLEFRTENPDYVPSEDPATDDINSVFLPTKLSGSHLARAEVAYGTSQGINTPQVSLVFNSEGGKLFAELTKENIGKRIAIFLDKQLLSAPVVQTEIRDGKAVITGDFTLAEAQQLATRLNSGALPVPIKLLSQQNIGPSLGKSSVAKSLVAGFIGLISVALFMLVFYRLPGFIAVLALIIYTTLSLSLFKLFNITLTLPGITGFILSIGMAIDANILIFERLKEELKKGKELTKGIEDGFKRAWTSIRDSNFSSLITTFILGYFGTSIIRGFAITLGLGILVSMFSAIIVTRTFLLVIVSINFFKRLKFFGAKEIHDTGN